MDLTEGSPHHTTAKSSLLRAHRRRRFPRRSCRMPPCHRVPSMTSAFPCSMRLSYARAVGTRTVRQDLTIVVLGAFNPPIFQPAWLGAEGLIRQGDAENARVEIVHQEVAVFETEWLRCQVTRERFSMMTRRESHYEALRDLIASVFRLLRHTPTRVCGINHTEALRFDNRDEFDNLGWRLVPRENWDGVLDRPGVARLDEVGQRDDGLDGYIRVQLEQPLNGTQEISAQVNDHIVFSEQPEHRSTAQLSEFLLMNWPAITARAAAIHERIQDLAKREFRSE